MRQKKAKQIRRLLKENPIEPMILVRNHCGSRTEEMSRKGIYRNFKRLYKQGKISLRK